MRAWTVPAFTVRFTLSSAFTPGNAFSISWHFEKHRCVFIIRSELLCDFVFFLEAPPSFRNEVIFQWGSGTSCCPTVSSVISAHVCCVRNVYSPSSDYCRRHYTLKYRFGVEEVLSNGGVTFAIPSASCLMVPIMLPLLIASFAASVASTPNTGITFPPSLLYPAA